jgi:glycosyltransferase involved in cell wall biosynthesis
MKQSLHVLFVTYGMPQPTATGARIRDFSLIREVAKRHRVSVLSLLEFPEEADLAHSLLEITPDVRWTVASPTHSWRTLADLSTAIASRRPLATQGYWNSDFSALVTRTIGAWRPDIVEVEHSFLAPYRRAIPGNRATRTVLSFHNFAERQYRSMRHMRLGPASRAGYFVKALLMQRWESREARHFDSCIAVSELDAAELRRRLPDQRVHVIDNGVDASRLQPLAEPGDSETILFVGTLRYAPNLDAVKFLRAQVWPYVRRACPRAKLVIVGQLPQDPDEFLRDSDGVDVMGAVDDLTPYYRRAAVVVAPLRAGGGTRLKVLEAMAVGRPVVSTTVGCEGLDVHDGAELLMADEPIAFAQHVVQLLGDPRRRAQLASRARALVERRYDWPIIGEKLLAAYEEIAA